MVQVLDVGRVREVFHAQRLFGFGEPGFRDGGGAKLLVHLVIRLLGQERNHLVHFVVFFGGLLGGAGNNQRRSSFVNEDGVHFVHDGVAVRALDAIGQVELHVVAQVVEPEFVVGAVGDVRVVGRAPLLVLKVVDDHAHA